MGRRQKEGGIKFCLDCALSFPGWILSNKDILKILKKLMVADIDYKDAKLLRQFITERGKIMPRRLTGTCAKHQRNLAAAVKTARIIALVPFTLNK